MADLYIWIPHWFGDGGFQHYTNRDPIWIKNYTRLLSHDAYGDLSYHQRGILHGIWMEYARSNRQLPHSTLILTRRLGHRVLTRDLVSLSDAGFIEVIASNVLAARLHDASLEKKRVEADGDLPSSIVNEVPEPAPEPEVPLRSDDIDFSGNGAGAGAGDLNIRRGERARL